MKPIEFKHCNTEFAKHQKEYNTLPALKIPTVEGTVTTCWRLSFKERLRVLFLGNVWMQLMTFNNPLQPSLLTTSNRELYHHPDFDLPWHKQLKMAISWKFRKIKTEFKSAKKALDNVENEMTDGSK